MAIVTKDGQVIPTGNTVDTTGQSLGGGFYLPDTKEKIYGAFGDIQEKRDEPIVYNVYQQRAQTYDQPQYMQYTYGTQSNPVFEWVKTIQTGQRSYNPQSDFDNAMLEEYKKMTNAGMVGEGAMTPEEIMKQMAVDTAVQIGGQAGAKIGAALVDPSLQDQTTIQRGLTGLKSTFSDLPLEYSSNLKSALTDAEVGRLKDMTIIPNLSTKEMASATNNTELFNSLRNQNKLVNINAGTKSEPLFAVSKQDANLLSDQALRNEPFIFSPDNKYHSPNIRESAFITKESFDQAEPSMWETTTSRLDWGTAEGKANWASAAGAAGVSFVTSLAMGEKPLKAAKRAGGMALGRAVGTAVAGPIGGVVGGIAGSILGGRVICNELCRQKIMDRKQVLLDYKFTKEYLTPQHVSGYHIWAVWMVKQMRKGKFVKFWSHVAGHRANEIEFIYGKRNKPDYLGKLYRKILEPLCWIIGAFTKETDWSILYKQKEI